MLQQWPNNVKNYPLQRINIIWVSNRPTFRQCQNYYSLIRRSCTHSNLFVADKLSSRQAKHIYEGNQSLSSVEGPCTTACFRFLKHFAVGDLFPIHAASHLFILLHAICFSVERFQVLLIPYLIFHGKQFIIDIDLNHLDSRGAGNSSCLSFICDNCFKGISKLCYYEVLKKTQQL